MQLWNETKKGNPFAYSALLAIEKELDELIGHIKSQKEVMRNQLDKINRSGIHVGIMVNREPTKIPVRVAGLGFN
ncbi:AcaB family transcriptional regulator, partial [Neisseria sp. P0015.S002]|uniref:AcaB family transcriptional regulator n=1 Tax=Neisseria sp. P0015.S002 TaxID=3436758 RepID=UPI003F80EFF6